MQIIIFSFNRACQLSTLIDSILENLRGEYEIEVIYNTSNAKYEEGYSLLKNRLSSLMNIRFHKEHPTKCKYYFTWGELANVYNLKLLYLCPFLRKRRTDFRDLLIRLLKESKSKSTMFLTDDAIFIKQCGIDKQTENWIGENPSQRQFSFRHGCETIKPEDKIIRTINGFSWKFSDFGSNSHWGYNFSLDAHVYNTRSMFRFLRRISFSNPNTLESSGMLHAGKRRLFMSGKCDTNMGILSFPINIVQTTFKNDALQASPLLLNDYFLNGYRLILPIPKSYNTFQIYPDEITLLKGFDERKIGIK